MSSAYEEREFHRCQVIGSAVVEAQQIIAKGSVADKSKAGLLTREAVLLLWREAGIVLPGRKDLPAIPNEHAQRAATAAKAIIIDGSRGSRPEMVHLKAMVANELLLQAVSSTP